MDNDLISICEAIGIPGAQDVSTQASDILAAISGERRAFDISGNEDAFVIPLQNAPSLQPLVIVNKPDDIQLVALNIIS